MCYSKTKKIGLWVKKEGSRGVEVFEVWDVCEVYEVIPN
jgi:hypothetical protein